MILKTKRFHHGNELLSSSHNRSFDNPQLPPSPESSTFFIHCLSFIHSLQLFYRGHARNFPLPDPCGARFFPLFSSFVSIPPRRSEGLRGFLDTFASHAVIWRASETAWRRGEEDRISLLGISRSCSLEASNNRTTEVRVPLPYLPSHPPPILYVRLKFARWRSQAVFAVHVVSRLRGESTVGR